MKIPISKNPDTNWRSDAIQFPRLIAELEAAGVFTYSRVHQLCVAMDLTPPEIHNLIDRAQAAWDDVKARTKPGR